MPIPGAGQAHDVSVSPEAIPAGTGSDFRPNARLELGILVRHNYLLQGANSH